jgi:hypothetical protein
MPPAEIKQVAVLRSLVRVFTRTFQNPIEGRVPLLVNFAALRFLSIYLGSVAQLRCSQILRDLPDSVLNVFPGEV